MKKIFALLLLALTSCLLAQEEIKKDREPVFVLPDVVVSGESDLRVGVEKKDLLPANYPMPPKETPLMEMEFIKGPYLEEDKRSPMLEKTEGKNQFGELTAYAGTFDNYFAKLAYGRQFENLSFIINLLGDKKNFLLQDSCYTNISASGDLTYFFNKALKLGLTLDYENETIKTPYASTLGFSSVIKDFYTAYLRASLPLMDKLSLTSYFSFARSDLSTFGVVNNETSFGVKTDFEMVFENKKHLPGLGIDFRNDNIFGWSYSAALEDRFKIENTDIFVALKSDNGWLFVNAKAVFDVDGFTRVFVSYEPGRVYPKFKNTYDDDIYLVNPGLMAENTWLNIGVGVEHRLLKQIPVTLEFYRKEISDLISYESAGLATSPVNISKASIIGVNVKEEWKIFDGLTQKLIYKYVNAANPDNPVMNIPYIPLHSATLSGEYVITDWTFDASFEYRGDIFYSQTVTDKLKDVFLVSAGVKKSFGGNITVFVKGENLLNREYQNIKDYSLPKAAIKAGVTVNF
ncbi:MAG: hypothetical protein A2497_07225 [Candidatus Firestonebacteria bacterium RifOxyC12_full_39_7]|nr:MAG: hypothetical protein A2497_07225 [Candidatus Firestonebacteria bacterium RifOxyC12_full_39_7]